MPAAAHVLPRARAVVALVALAVAVVACTDDATPYGLESDESVAPRPVFPITTTIPPVGPGTTAPPPLASPLPPPPASSPLAGLVATVLTDRLREPVGVIAAPDGAGLWVLERAGRIVAVTPGADPDEPAAVATVLDLRREVLAEGSEQGLLSMAVHPRYPDGGAFVYLVTADDDDTELRHYLPIASDPSRLDPDSARVVLAIEQPHEWHNGGTVTFGPDGYLYLSLGDGGRIGDPYGNAQDPTTLLGAILRLDVDAHQPYAIPPDNPFDGEDGAREVWVYGLRNPWRITTDAATGYLVIADVGQDLWEEINLASLRHGGGTNFGWPVVTGGECFQHPIDRRESLPPPVCEPDGFAPAALVIDRSQGCAVIGGLVYRGSAIPELWGHYVYSDYCRGVLRSFPLAEAIAGRDIEPVEHLGELGRVTSVGTDAGGELVLTDQDGRLLRIDPVRAA